MDSRKLATKIMAHAKANYEDGWDTTVECYNIDDLVEHIEKYGYKSVADYKKNHVDPYNDYADDIRATAF
jgi:hypothetical protein